MLLSLVWFDASVLFLSFEAGAHVAQTSLEFSLELLILCPYLPTAGKTDMCFHSKLECVFLPDTVLSLMSGVLSQIVSARFWSLWSVGNRESCSCSDGESEGDRDFL